MDDFTEWTALHPWWAFFIAMLAGAVVSMAMSNRRGG